MQAVIAVQPWEPTIEPDAPICGVPLLKRIILTALRSGCSRVLLLCPPAVPAASLLGPSGTAAPPTAEIDAVDFDAPFNEGNAEHWARAADRLEHRFLWIPGNYIPHRTALADLLTRASLSPEANVCFRRRGSDGSSILSRPTVLLRSSLVEDSAGPLESLTFDQEPGIVLQGRTAVTHAEAALVRHSGKVTDGIFSTFNRKLCRPAVRWLSRTTVTPNAVTFGGLAVALLSGMLFAQGTWLSDVAGAILFFMSGLFDEMDGMLARLKFQESPFGCWLETMVDYTTYLLIFAGIAIGGYHRSGAAYLVLGAALLCGSVLSFWVISIQRTLAAPADRPNEYSRRYLSALERDGSNPLSGAVRQLQFLTRKGVLMHYLLLFAICGMLPVFLALAALGANIAWMVTIYFNVRLFSGNSRAVRASQDAVVAEVKQ